jgi:hypothetical protein
VVPVRGNYHNPNFASIEASIHIRPATASEYEVSVETPPVAELQLRLGGVADVTLTLSPGVGGGTGSKLWSGGLLLAEWLLAERNNSTSAVAVAGRSVLELGQVHP